MATNDLITRLILQTKEFDGNLQRSAKEMRNFENEISGKVGKGIKQFDVGLKGLGVSLGSLGWGAAIAGGVAFAKMGLDASQQGNEFNNVIKASKQTLESFAQAVMTADFSSFNDGLYTAWNRAKDLAGALDVLQNMQLAKNVFDSRVVFEFNSASKKVSDTTLSIKERQEALNEEKRLEIELGQKSVDVQNQLKTTIEKTWEAETGTDITAEQIRNIAEMGGQYDMIKKKQEELNALGRKGIVDEKGNLWSTTELNIKKYNAIRAELGKYSSDQRAFAKMWYKFSADQRKALGEQLILVNTLGQTQLGYQKQLMADEKTLTDAKKQTAAASKPQFESLDSLNRKAESLRVKMAKAFEKGDSAGFTYYKSELAKIQKQIDDVNKSFRQAGKEGELKAPGVQKLKVSTQFKLDEQHKSDLAKGIKGVFDDKQLNKFNSELKIVSKNIQEASKQEYFLGKLGDTNFKRLAADLSEVGTAVSSISDNPAIRALAASLMILQGVQSLKTATTWVEYVVGGISLATTIATMASTFANMSKFAGGGIVGDQNLVRINSGEMILNHAQQTRLFNAINSGRTETQSASPVEFVIRGQDLIGVQKNYNSKFGKK